MFNWISHLVVIRTKYGLPCSYELLKLQRHGLNIELSHLNIFLWKLNDDTSEIVVENDLRLTFYFTPRILGRCEPHK